MLRCTHFSPASHSTYILEMAVTQVQLPLPVLPEDWSAEKDFKAIGTLSPATQRNIEPVGPHFLAHARRVRWRSSIAIALTKKILRKLQKRHHRTFSEDERIQAQENVKKVEDDDAGEISEPENPLMLQRDAKDWKVLLRFPLSIDFLVAYLLHLRFFNLSHYR